MRENNIVYKHRQVPQHRKALTEAGRQGPKQCGMVGMEELGIGFFGRDDSGWLGMG